MRRGLGKLVFGAAFAAVAGCGGDGTPHRLPPETAIDQAPAAITNQPHVRITFHASGLADQFTCQLDGGVPSGCTSPFETDVTDGPHMFQVAAAIGAAVDVTPAAVSWKVDTVPPDTAIIDQPPALDNSLTPTFTFAGTDDQGAVTLECALDDGAFAACTSPAKITVVDGAHRYRVRAVDAAGNVDPTPATASWTLDSAAPDTMITAGPANGVTTGGSASFAFSSPDSMATFECKLDAADFTTCTSPQDFTLAGGAHTFAVRAKDLVGLVDPSPATRTWTVDTTPPPVMITATPNNPTNSTTGAFGFSSSDATAAFACHIDAGAFAACTSGFTFAGLTDGSHTFTVRATDPVGNASSASFTWSIDTVPPTATITAGPPAASPSPSATFSFTTAGAPVVVACSLDGGAFTACASPVTLTGNADGMHTFIVRATDAAGNQGSDSRTWTVDTVAPVVTVTAVATPTNNNRPSVAFTVTGATTIQCQVDAGRFAACTSPFTPAALADGSHSVTVRGTDAVGNVGTGSTTFTV
ncbi:MAG TPA: hypothetical protein VFD36_10795, partial [Kofleriaceae bacterium]|nr:hypothetical protein [Kofleriaceae bacterium]